MKIDSLFKETKISVIDTSRYYGWFDDWSMAIKFEQGDNVVREVKGTRNYMPYRITPVIGALVYDIRKRGLIK